MPACAVRPIPAPRLSLLVLAAALLLPGIASAQSTPATTAASAPASPAKKELVRRLIALQQPSIEGLARSLVERPARQLMAAGEPVLQNRIAAEQREAVVKQVQEEVRKYMDAALPPVRERANKLAQTTLAPAFEARFSEDELRQIVAFLESPANKKLQTALPELSETLARQLVVDSRAQVEPKVKSLEAGIAKALGVPLQPASAPASAAGAKPATAASKP